MGLSYHGARRAADALSIQEELLLEEKRSETRTLTTGGSKTWLILIDDDVFVCRALRTQLEILGFDVLVFSNAEDLLVSEFPTDNACLLLDIYLPGMNGIELCRRLTAKGTDLPTVLMTGRDDRLTRRLIRAAKPKECLFKPFDQDSLLRAIQDAMHSSSKPFG